MVDTNQPVCGAYYYWLPLCVGLIIGSLCVGLIIGGCRLKKEAQIKRRHKAEDESMQLDAAESGAKELERQKQQATDELRSKNDEAEQKGASVVEQLHKQEELANLALKEQQAKQEQIQLQEAAEQREKVSTMTLCSCTCV